jgi:hypothetical protein
MRLVGSQGTELRLDVVGYQFPDAAPEADGFDYDANWLVVAGEVSDGERSWRFRDACLTTVETGELASWLEGIAGHKPVVDELAFTEPILTFSWAPASVGDPIVHVTFELEARPPWHRMTGDREDWGTVSLDFPVSRDALRLAAQDLRSDQTRFPERRR